MLSLLMGASLAGASYSLILTIVALIFLAFAAFFTTAPVAGAPFYRRIHLGWAGLFCALLAYALSGR